MENKREKLYSISGVLTSFLLCLLFMVISILPAWMLALRFLSSNQNWSQPIVYSVEPASPPDWKVKECLELEYIRIRNIAYSRFPELARDLKARFDTQALTLTLNLTVSQERMLDSGINFGDSFSELISQSVKQAGADDLIAAQSAQSKIEKWVDQKEQLLLEKKHKKIELENEISSYEQEIIEAQFKLNNYSIPKESDNTKPIGIDVDIDLLKSQLSKLDDKQHELDLLAAKAVDSVELADIDRKRDLVFAGRQKVIEQIGDAQTQIDKLEAVKPEKISSPELKSKLSRARDRKNIAQNQLNRLSVEIENLKSQIGFMKEFIPDVSADGDNLDSKLPFSVVSNKDYVFSAIRPLSAVVISSRYSTLQLLAISLAGVFGLAVGVVVSRRVVRPVVDYGLVREDVADDGFDYSDLNLDKYDNEPGVSDERPEVLPVAVEPDVKETRQELWQDLQNLEGFESWWVESYDKIAYELLNNYPVISEGIIFSSSHKNALSPRFIINLSISLALKGSNVLLINASQEKALEQIFADFGQGEMEGLSTGETNGSTEKQYFTGPGFWDCLASDYPPAVFTSESPLVNLRFLHSGNIISPKDINNEINNNSDYAEINFDSDFDCIIIYMPELLENGIKEFEKLIAGSPYSDLVCQFNNIAAADLVGKKSARKVRGLKKSLTAFGCNLIEL